MTTPYDAIKSAILGNPVDPNKMPSRTGVVKSFSEMQVQLEAAQAGAYVRDTKANLDLLLAAPVSAMAWVTGDATVANNGIYENTGTAVAAVWTRRVDIPQFLITGINVGAGTANAIQVTTDLPMPVEDGRCLLVVPVLSTNTASPVTVAINGGAALEILTVSGTQIEIGGITSGMMIVGFISAGKFRLLSDQASAAIIAQAQSYANAAAAAANAGFVFDTEADFEAANIPLVLQFVQTAGYYVPGDGGGHLKKRISTPVPVEAWHKQSADGAWWEISCQVANPLMFGAQRGRANAAAATVAWQALIDFAIATGAEIDHMPGAWFISGVGLKVLAPVKWRGRGMGYWHTYSPVANNGTNGAAGSTLILTGTGTKTISPHGMSTMAPSGGVINNPSARAGWNESQYTLLNLQGSFSCGLYIGPDAIASELNGFRVMPDSGGDDGLQGYNDAAATASSPWADDWDFGIVVDSVSNFGLTRVQSVGHYRMAGLLITAITVTPSTDTPSPPYYTTFTDCEFSGYRAVAVRGSDTYKILALTATYVEIEYFAGHPFNVAVDNRIAFSHNDFSHSSTTFTGTSIQSGGTRLRIEGITDKTASFSVGDTIVARAFGGGTSQVHFKNCKLFGMTHPSGRQCHDQALGANAMPNPGCAIECSGARMAEIIFDDKCSVQTGEQVAIHLHEIVESQMPGMLEFNTDIIGSPRGLRVIMSPIHTSNTRVTNPAGSSRRITLGGIGSSTLLQNNGPSGVLDLRPAIELPVAAYPLFNNGSDNGFLQGQLLMIPALALWQDHNTANGVRTPRNGIGGIWDDTYPTPVLKFGFDADAAWNQLKQSAHIWPDTDDSRDLGRFGNAYRGAYINDIRLYPAASISPLNNGELVFQLTSNTQLTIKVQGSDGVDRSVNLTLA